ncbi:hypothetical protein N0V90_002274 [Kalmusia sp. IMI 367209]|nr:hypothetical protein N0V90_002274 [Kalmusia sp. IMI 367209]
MSRSSTSIELEPYAASTPITLTQPPSLHVKSDDTPTLAEDLQPINTVTSEALQSPTKGTTAIVLVTVVCVTMISTLLAGLVTVGLPTMAQELNIPPSLLLWPISIYALACGCTLLLLGSVADVVGSRPMYLTGCVLQSVFTLACGLAQTSTQLIVFRAFAGIAISFCLPSAVSIITSTFPEGKSRNIAFASMGGGQPIGFSVGLTLGGVFSNTIGWRWGFHIAAIINSVVFVIGLFGLPKVDAVQKDVWRRLRTEIDWVGIAIGGASLAMLSYAFAPLSASYLPPLRGAVANLVMGLLAHKIRADWAVIFGIAMSSIGALLMCIIQPEWTYWACAFPAVALNPIGADALFTVSNLVITSVFPAKTQALAGGVFNTIAQIGKSVGLATSGLIAASVTENSKWENKESPQALMEGYRAAFWYNLAGSIATALLFSWGLRGIGRVGMKRE